jgi:hypothetical protein
MTSIKALVTHQSLKALWGKVFFLHLCIQVPRHRASSSGEVFFLDADVAFKSLDTSLHTANKLLGLVADEVILWPEV